MPSHTLSVSQTATELGVSPSTVRRLCDEFSERLSDAARRVGGGARRFTAADVEVLREAIRLRGEGLSNAAIDEQLARLILPTPIVEAPRTPTDGPGTALAVIDALRNDAIWLAVAGFIAGLLVGLSVWWFQ